MGNALVSMHSRGPGCNLAASSRAWFDCHHHCSSSVLRLPNTSPGRLVGRRIQGEAKGDVSLVLKESLPHAMPVSTSGNPT